MDQNRDSAVNKVDEAVILTYAGLTECLVTEQSAQLLKIHSINSDGHAVV